MTARIALIGANGHGQWHLENIAALRKRRAVDLVAVCDRAPLTASTARLTADLGATAFTDHRELLTSTHPDVVIVATPPASHRELALAAMAAGADVLLEKPATVLSTDLEDVIVGATQTGRLCQIGFQSLGSAAVGRLAGMIGDGTLGEVRTVTAAGAWIRPHEYFTRGPWTGRRFVNGLPVGDGAFANPFAHAVMNCLEVARLDGDAAITAQQAELWHANDIETDDTGVLRIGLDNGRTLTVAVTLCADRLVEPALVVTGTRGTATWHYTTRTLSLNNASPQACAQDGLLENLLDASSTSELICPPQRCRLATSVSEWLLRCVPVRPVDPQYVKRETAADPVIIPGVTEVVQRAAAQGALFSELGVPWATAGRAP